MKKLLTLLLTVAFGLQATVPGEFDNVVTATVTQPVTLWQSICNTADAITLGDARRAVWGGITSAVTWTSETAHATAENVSYINKEYATPAWNNTYAATSETCSAAVDFGGLAKNTLHGAGKFIYDHPQVTLVAEELVTIYILDRSSSGVVEKEYIKLQNFIDNPLAAVTAFDTSVNNIRNERRILLSACDIYIPVNYTCGIGSWYYQGEAQAIDNFLKQVETLKTSVNANINHSVIASQAKQVKDAALLVQYMLTKRLNLYAAQGILSKK